MVGFGFGTWTLIWNIYLDLLWLGIFLFIILVSLGFVGIAGFIQYMIAYKNNKKCTKPVLVYDKDNDVFICYRVIFNNEKIVIKNGNISKIKGSSFNTQKLASIKYIDENGKRKNKIIGFCSNIDNYDLKNNINKYHNPRI